MITQVRAAFIRALGPRFHLRLAQQGVTLALPEHEPLLDAWLSSLPLAGDDDGLQVGATLSADAKRLTWRASNYEPIAIFEGLLGVDDPAAAEYVTRTGGPMVDLHYEGVGPPASGYPA